MGKPGTVVKGRVSWFGGGSDPGNANGTTASGVPDTAAGIAVRPGAHYTSGRPYLGGYWRVTTKNGRTAILKQIDIGPNESVGRRIDFTPAALKKLGYTTSSFPTDSIAKAVYLGRDPSKFGKVAASGGGTKTVKTRLPGTQTTTVDNSGKRAAIASWLQSSSTDPLTLAMNVAATPSTSSTTTTPGKLVTKTVPAGKPAAGKQAGSGVLGRVVDRANAIDRKHLPYLWGGGHQGKVNAYKAHPLDCSGAVSAALNINPRVSGELASWGRPGPGKHITIYANGEHTFLEINGKFWGTSHSNPGGGAGWIPRSQFNTAYLKNFTRRHPAGL